MDTKTYIISELLECGFMDTEFLCDLINDYKIEIDVEETRSNYWKIDINILIYDVLSKIAERFIAQNREAICEILNCSDLDEYLSENELYEIFTNYLDSHIWFYNDKIQSIFEKEYWI